jgi:hypothetical protein
MEGEKIERIDAVLAMVNAFVARHLWMDFSVWGYQGVDLVISGSIDESYWSDLRVSFHDVCWASLRFQGWKTDTRQPFLLRAEGAEAYSVNVRFDIEVGHCVFKIVPEDLNEPMWVAAREVSADLSRLDLTGK